MTELEYRRGLKIEQLMLLVTHTLDLVLIKNRKEQKESEVKISKIVHSTLDQLEAIDNADFSSNISEEKPF